MQYRTKFLSLIALVASFALLFAAPAAACDGTGSTNVLVMAEKADVIVVAKRIGSRRSHKIRVLQTLKGDNPGKTVKLPGEACDPFLETKGRYVVFLRKNKATGVFHGVATADSAIPLNGKRFTARPQTNVAPKELLRFLSMWAPVTSEPSKAKLIVDMLEESRGLIKTDALQYAFSYVHASENHKVLPEQCNAISAAISKSNLSPEKSSEWQERKAILCSPDAGSEKPDA